MASDRTFKDSADLQGLQGDAIIDLWFIDLWSLDPSLPTNQRFFRFVNYAVANGEQVRYASAHYLPIPYIAGGFEIKTDGVPPSPKLTVGNIGLEWTAFVNRWDDLVGAKIVRRRVLARHLDNGSDPDGNAHWPDEIWTIQQKTAESKLTVEFTLSTAFDLDGVTLPRRRALRYTCPWVYRSVDCGYAGPPVANRSDDPITSDNALIQDLSNARAAIPTASAAMRQAQADWAQAQTDVSTAQNEVGAASSAISNYNAGWKKRTNRYDKNRDRVYENSKTGGDAKWNGSNVSLGNSYRKEALKEEKVTQKTYNQGRIQRIETITEKWYEISEWYEDRNAPGSYHTRLANAQAALTAAQAAEATAETDYNNSVTAYNAALDTYRTAHTDWQAGGAPLEDDDCGKRLASCRLRWYDPLTEEIGDMSYGGFPGLSGL